ncbi:MAG: type II secretion system protein, partial [Candidatus Margulisiibacteriota bacterium]
KIQDNKQKGFTILEIIVAMVVMGIILPVIMNPMLTLLTKGRVNQQLFNMASLAEERLGYYQHLPFDQVISTPNTTFSSPFTDYKYKLVVDRVQGPTSFNTTVIPTSNYKEGTLSIMYKDVSTYNLVTIFARYDYK